MNTSQKYGNLIINCSFAGMKSDAPPLKEALITFLVNKTGYKNIFSNQLKAKASKNYLLVFYQESVILIIFFMLSK